MGGQAKFNEPWCLALFELLDDGDWHDWETVMKEVGPAVPDELAFEKGEYYRAYYYRRRGETVRPRLLGGKAATIRSGQRLVLTRTIRLLETRRRVILEFEEQGPRRKKPVRLRMPLVSGEQID